MTDSSSKKFVDDLVNSNELVVFSKSYCPFSQLAKNIIKYLNFKDVKVVDFDKEPNWKDIQEYLGNLYKSNLPAPRIFVKGKCAAGGVEVLKGDRPLKEKLLIAAGLSEYVNSEEYSIQIQEFVQSLLRKHKLVMFSKSYCIFSNTAKSVLNRYGKIEDLVIVELEDMEDCDSIQNYLKTLCDGVKTVPRIFLDGKCIGGGMDINQLNNEGKLVPMLVDAGVKLDMEKVKTFELASKAESSSQFAKKFVDDILDGYMVVVFSKRYCPFCLLAKGVLSQYNIKDLKIVEIEDMPECKQIQDYLGSICGGESTVPRIFVDKKFIGGGTDMEKLHTNGELKEILGV
ncbi:hypothetical protein ACOME3_004976 [Neoechinorhynchus agilis]